MTEVILVVPNAISAIAVQLVIARSFINDITDFLLTASFAAEGFATCNLPEASLIAILLAIASDVAPCTSVVFAICSSNAVCTAPASPVVLLSTYSLFATSLFSVGVTACILPVSFLNTIVLGVFSVVAPCTSVVASTCSVTLSDTFVVSLPERLISSPVKVILPSVGCMALIVLTSPADNLDHTPSEYITLSFSRNLISALPKFWVPATDTT